MEVRHATHYFFDNIHIRNTRHTQQCVDQLQYFHSHKALRENENKSSYKNIIDIV